MRLVRFRYFLMLPLLSFLLTIASAQSFRGSIRGIVTDPTGGVLPKAKVTAKNVATGLQREATTGPDGAYVIAELPAGTYTVTAQAVALSRVSQNVAVNVGLDSAANFELSQMEKASAQVTVTAEDVPLMQTTSDVLGQVVEQKLVNELPLNGRDFGKLVALVPGTTVDPSGVAGTEGGFGQFNINGNRDRSNNYTLDGTDNNDPFFNNSALNQTGIGGAPASLLPIDAIQEFNLQSQFSAEYGRNSGSVVNIITRSGSNQLHGSAYEFFRNSGLDARNYFNTESRKTVFQNNNFGASVGGPVIKNKTFFFGAYEGQRGKRRLRFPAAGSNSSGNRRRALHRPRHKPRRRHQSWSRRHTLFLSAEHGQPDCRRRARYERWRLLHRQTRSQPLQYRASHWPICFRAKLSSLSFRVPRRLRHRVSSPGICTNLAHSRASSIAQPAFHAFVLSHQ
jgi:hypothetical protein